ncbi:conserved hypothetical protein [Methylocella silvestris BL2]|uniref:YhaN AAA domain-containing protein n=1 Tax=Methylocella silvestris (strain DSM 15510 / CIP 108128 / LMG 27833 / NCIMB 13906 / BL2) TaxID=395965 RepID=B8ET60_METSB|nr:YhaN family protein [Methylocella silvestris]ACK51198.1 conserved hypothetical protein [Methylocella silvestris BL2]
MRFQSLTLECYGRFKETSLKFPDSPGLCIVFGPNEAGKSTALEGISDFLFGVPERSRRVEIFGADKLKIGATIALANGTELSLRRRKGRLRTLTSEAGEIVDEAILAQLLGPTGRDRFQSLFGLTHASLRSGGDDLLAADGEIGRLILAAGGGLGSLLPLVEQLRKDATALFTPRAAKERAFYAGLDAFNAADAAIKSGLVTREKHEKAQQSLNAARDTLEARRRRLAEVTAEKLRLERMARVAPAIRVLDRLSAEIEAHAELARLGDDFAASCCSAIEGSKTGEKALADAELRLKTLEAKIGALNVPTTLIAAEAEIASIGIKALHVAKARDDRRNRERELAESSEKLRTLRQNLRLASDEALEAASPPPDAISRVQKLAAEGVGRRAALAAIKEERLRETQTREAIFRRQEGRREAGAHEPLGFAAEAFSALPDKAAAIAAKELRLRKTEGELARDLARQNLASFDDLIEQALPDTPTIESEIDRRASVETEFSRLAERIEAEADKAARAGADIDRLMIGGPPATFEAIAAARAARDDAFAAIKALYLSPNAGAAPPEQRAADVALSESRTRAADDLSDRRSLEAERVAALELAAREKSAADVALATLAERRKDVLARREALLAAWRAAWPAAGGVEDLGRLKHAVIARAGLLARWLELRAQTEALAGDAAALAPRLDALSRAEARLRLGSDARLADRVDAAIRATKAHEDSYADFRRDQRALEDSAANLERIDASHHSLILGEARWSEDWSAALALLGVGAPVALEEANEIATLWAAAHGHFEAMRVTRNRLKRMDEDEAELAACVRALAEKIDLALPQDAVAAATLLAERQREARDLAIKRESLESELPGVLLERDEAARRALASRAELDALAARAGCAGAELAALAARCAERAEIARRMHEQEARIEALGDGLPLAALRAQWGGRDIDEIKAAAAELEGEMKDLEPSVEEARAMLQDRSRESAALTSHEGVNAAVAARERATAEMHETLERYVEIVLAEELLREAMDKMRDQQKDPLIARAGALFSAATRGAFSGVGTDMNAAGQPIVVGRRAGGAEIPVALMSDGARDQLYLAFRIASVERYADAAEPLPFIADDLLVHFDDERSAATLELLAGLAETTQVLLFTHHRSVSNAAADLARRGKATVIEIGGD